MNKHQRQINRAVNLTMKLYSFDYNRAKEEVKILLIDNKLTIGEIREYNAFCKELCDFYSKER